LFPLNPLPVNRFLPRPSIFLLFLHSIIDFSRMSIPLLLCSLPIPPSFHCRTPVPSSLVGPGPPRPLLGSWAPPLQPKGPECPSPQHYTKNGARRTAGFPPHCKPFVPQGLRSLSLVASHQTFLLSFSRTVMINSALSPKARANLLHRCSPSTVAEGLAVSLPFQLFSFLLDRKGLVVAHYRPDVTGGAPSPLF